MLDRYLGRRPSLDELDWTFTQQRESRTQDLTHGIHVYPARMVPEIARRIIERFTDRESLVLDPFCGSGGVLLEAMTLGRPSIGFDLNPLACLISRVKTTPLNPSVLRSRLRTIKSVAQSSSKIIGGIDGSLRTINLDHWFPPNVIEPLLRLKSAIDNIEDSHVRDFFRVMLSETVRKVSFTRKNEYKLYIMAEEDRRRFRPDTLKTFLETCSSAIASMAKLWSLTTHVQWVQPIVTQTDSRGIPLTENQIDLILTSPPYGDSHTTVGYGQFSKLSLAWLGIDGRQGSVVDSRSLGGKTTAPRDVMEYSESLKLTLREIEKQESDLKTKRAPTVISFFYDYLLCLREMARVCRSEGICCIVIGNRSVRGIRIPTDLITIELADVCGFNHLQTIYRSIPSKRHPVSQKLYVDPKWVEAKRKRKPETIANIVRESIILLKRR